MSRKHGRRAPDPPEGTHWIVMALVQSHEGRCPLHGYECPQTVVMQADLPKMPRGQYLVCETKTQARLQRTALLTYKKCWSYAMERMICKATQSDYTHIEWFFPHINYSFSVDIRMNQAFRTPAKTYQSPNSDWVFYAMLVHEDVHDAMIRRLESCIGAPYDEGAVVWYPAMCISSALFGCSGAPTPLWQAGDDDTRDMGPVTCARLAAKAMISGGLLSDTYDLKIATAQQLLDQFVKLGAKKYDRPPEVDVVAYRADDDGFTLDERSSSYTAMRTDAPRRATGNARPASDHFGPSDARGLQPKRMEFRETERRSVRCGDTRL